MLKLIAPTIIKWKIGLKIILTQKILIEDSFSFFITYFHFFSEFPVIPLVLFVIAFLPDLIVIVLVPGFFVTPLVLFVIALLPDLVVIVLLS